MLSESGNQNSGSEVDAVEVQAAQDGQQMLHGAVGMLEPAVVFAGSEVSKYIAEDGITEQLVHFGVEQAAVVVCKGEAVLASVFGSDAGFLIHDVAHLDDDLFNDIGEADSQIGFVENEEDQVFFAEQGAGKGNGTADMAHGTGTGAGLFKDALYFGIPVFGEHEGADIHLLDTVEHLFNILRSIAALVQPLGMVDIFISGTENFADTLYFGELGAHSVIVFGKETTADDLFSLVVIALVEVGLPYGVDGIPGVALFAELCINAFMAHADAQSYLRCIFGEAIFFMSKLVIFPKLFNIKIKFQHDFISFLPIFVIIILSHSSVKFLHKIAEL